MTYGETLEEARARAVDAIEGYLECLEEDGLPLPESDPVAVPPLVDQIRVIGNYGDTLRNFGLGS